MILFLTVIRVFFTEFPFLLRGLCCAGSFPKDLKSSPTIYSVFDYPLASPEEDLFSGLGLNVILAGSSCDYLIGSCGFDPFSDPGSTVPLSCWATRLSGSFSESLPTESLEMSSLTSTSS